MADEKGSIWQIRSKLSVICSKAGLVIQISPLGVLKGKLPPRALSLVIEWAQVHQKELMEDWNYAAKNKKLQKIPPSTINVGIWNLKEQ
jgi:hypothetical protein